MGFLARKAIRCGRRFGFGPPSLARLSNPTMCNLRADIIFRIADIQGCCCSTLNIAAITEYIGDNAKSFQNQYGKSAAHRSAPSSAGCYRWTVRRGALLW
ncbi:hypothetical protein ACLK19_28835 [Escherichia coli]